MGHITQCDDNNMAMTTRASAGMRSIARAKRSETTVVDECKMTREIRMLDLSMHITEECVYPKCEGGYDMCCDTMVCGAQNEICRLRFRALRPAAARAST